ncbi:alpha/beta fold hydrolase [Candidatus Woesearchaeota archaeon]|nr:alpha/beta fold hydrolase [Candidatus Woesearchaeota archaeon]
MSKRKRKSDEASNKNRIWILISIIAVALILLSLFSFKLYIYFKFILGEDLLVKIDAPNDISILSNGDKAIAHFETTITANPFCEIVCTYGLEDLSHDSFQEVESVKIKTRNFQTDYIVSAPSRGEGTVMYRYFVDCLGHQSFLCNIEDNSSSRSLLPVSYVLSAEQESYRELARDKIEGTVDKINIISQIEQYSDTDYRIESLNNSIMKNILFWQNDDYEFASLFNTTNIDMAYEYALEEYGEIKYTYLVEKALLNEINKTYTNLQYLSNLKVLMNKTEEIDKLIEDYNLVIGNTERLIDIDSFVLKMSKSVSEYLDEGINSTCENCTECEQMALALELDQSCYSENITSFKLDIDEVGTINQVDRFILQDNPARCCMKDRCDECGYDKSNNYPTLFVHGHAFNKDTSADFSVDGFTKIQSRLEDSGIIDGGSFTLYTKYQSWLGNLPYPFSFKVSYYYDTLYQPDDIILVQTKSENIDTYAIRMHEILENIKKVTGKDKVNIVAHSMGGLVMRRYMQLFGEDDLDKVIFVAVPNLGIEGNVASLCGFAGSRKECEDMDKNSVFISKISRYRPSLNITNIIATGCNMQDARGDGILSENSQYLEYADNIYINGTCDGINPFHNTILNIDRYAKVFNIINGTLAEE